MRRTLLYAGGLFILLVFGFIGKVTPAISGASVGDIEALLNHFKCYEVTETGGIHGHPDVNLTDQFGPLINNVPVKDVELFCNPVKKDTKDINTEPLNIAEAHLLCYRIEAENDEGKQIDTQNQIEFATLNVDDDARLLCVPTLKLAVRAEVEEEEEEEEEEED